MRRGLSGFFVLALAAVATSPANAADPTEAMFDPGRVIDVRIALPDDDWDRLRAQERTLVSLLGGACLAQPFANPFTWFAADVTIDGQLRSGAAVRKKGFLGSLDTKKPSLKIDLDEFRDNDPVHGVKKLTLNNAKQDPALVRQCLGYQLFGKAGLPAPRCNFAHVHVNGHDLGVYVNVEEIRKPMLARHFASTKGNLYEGTVSDFHPVLIRTFEAQTNEATNDRSDLARVVDALNVGDANVAAALDAIVDLERFRTYWAMEGLIGFWDGYSSNRNNFYLYNDPSTGKFHFLPWGIDGILSDGAPIAAFQPGPNQAMFAYSTIARRLAGLPGAQLAYAARMNALLDSVWNEADIETEIDRMQALLAPHAGDLAPALLPLRAFVGERRARVTDALAAPVAFPPFSVLDYCLAEIGSVSSAFAASWGTHATSAPFAPGVSSMRGAIAGLSSIAATGTADAGLSPSDPNRHRGFLTLSFDLGGDRQARIAARFDPTSLAPGARLVVDGQQVDASLQLTEGVALLDEGTVRFNDASTAPGDRLCGTLEAKAYVFTGRYLVGGPPLPPFDPVIPSLPRTTGLGDVMRHCKPGRH